MAGTPKKRAMVAELTRRARLELDDDEEISDELAPLFYCALRVASGTTLTEVANELTATLHADGVLAEDAVILRESLYKYLLELRKKAGAGGDGILTRARARGAHAIAEQARLNVRNAALTKEAVAKAKLELESDLWLAERWNREELGQVKPGVQVAISFNGMHLDALRARAHLVEQQATAQLTSGATGDSDNVQDVEHEYVSD